MCSGTYPYDVPVLETVFGIVENFVAELYAGTRGILSGFFIILVVLVDFSCGRTSHLRIGVSS